MGTQVLRSALVACLWGTGLASITSAQTPGHFAPASRWEVIFTTTADGQLVMLSSRQIGGGVMVPTPSPLGSVSPVLSACPSWAPAGAFPQYGFVPSGPTLTESYQTPTSTLNTFQGRRMSIGFQMSGSPCQMGSSCTAAR